MAFWGRKNKAEARGAGQETPRDQARKSEIPAEEPLGLGSQIHLESQGNKETAKNTPLSPMPLPAPPGVEAKPQVGVSNKAAVKSAESKRLLLSFGEVISVLMRTPQFKGMTLAQIETLVVPPVLAGQFVVAEATSHESGLISPIGAALWARVSADVDKRIEAEINELPRLSVQEWRSGDIPWLVVMAGDPRILNPMLRNVQQTLLKGTPLKARVRNQQGKMEVGFVRTS